jgi:hypothetical protein
MDKILDDRVSIFPDELKRLYILPVGISPKNDGANSTFNYKTTEELATLGWRVCRNGDPFPQNPIRISSSNVAEHFAGLFQAMQRGVPIVPTIDSVAGNFSVETYSAGSAAEEAVLIEVTGDATRLMGVQYAHHQHAKLVLYEEPDATQIESARAAMEHRQEQASKAIEYVLAHRDLGSAITELTELERLKLNETPQSRSSAANLKRFDLHDFLKALRQFFVPDWCSDAIGGIEEAVSAVVPHDVLREVGELPLTAFTSAVPYNFLKKGSISWSRKPIGHVTGDASLLVLAEYLRKPNVEGVEFNAIFDPGHIETTETADVLKVLQGRVAHTIVLPKEEASVIALIHLSATLPVEDDILQHAWFR